MNQPTGTIAGIDVSHWQQDVDWASQKARGILFAYAKATEGGDTVDAYFTNNWTGMKAAGILRGTYHFFHPNAPAQDQANAFLASLAAVNGNTPILSVGDLPPALDLEVDNGVPAAQIVAGATQWLLAVEAATGRRPMIYVNDNFWRNTMGNSGDLSSHPLWLAHLNVAAPAIPGGWGTFTIWQYTIEQNAPGITGLSGQLDRDAFAGVLDDLRRFAGY